jgi:hypothetical protein
VLRAAHTARGHDRKRRGDKHPQRGNDDDRHDNVRVFGHPAVALMIMALS